MKNNCEAASKKGKLQKGLYIKYNLSVYMIVGVLESEYENKYAFAGIKIITKDGRFKFDTKTLKSFCSSEYRYEVIENFNVDQRDEVILNEFIHYINNFDLKIDSKYVILCSKNTKFRHVRPETSKS